MKGKSYWDFVEGHVDDGETLATAWRKLAKFFKVNTKAKKLWLKS